MNKNANSADVKGLTRPTTKSLKVFIERRSKSRPKLRRGQTSDDEWFSTESTLSESDSTCKI